MHAQFLRQRSTFSVYPYKKQSSVDRFAEDLERHLAGRPFWRVRSRLSIARAGRSPFLVSLPSNSAKLDAFRVMARKCM